MKKLFDRELTQQELNQFNIMLNTFNVISQSPISETSEKWLLETLPKSLPLFTHLTNQYNFPKIERITINRSILKENKRIRNISHLKFPPKKEFVTKYGRCNLREQSIFYGAPIIMTALAEMKPKKGDLITKSIWKLKEKHSLKMCPIFHVQPTNGTLNLNSFQLQVAFNQLVDKNFKGATKEAVVNLSNFIAHHFSKIVNRDNDRDYLFSAYFANKLLYELDGGTIDGILYPSVQEHLSFENIALKPEIFDKYYILDEVSEAIVTKDRSDGSGGLLMRGTSHCKKFNFDTQTILWEEGNNLSSKEMEHYQKEYNIDLT